MSGGVKFGFAKSVPKSAVVESALRPSDSALDESLERIQTFDGSRKRKADAPLVIPLIKRNNYPQSLSTAAQEVIKEATKLNEEFESREARKESSIIVDMLANRPEGETNEGQINFDARPEESKLEDYEKIPINGFGMAMLRGMGFKKNVGIGRTFKKAVDPIEVNLRPKGLGLGATPAGGPLKGCKEDDDDEEPARPIRKGDRVFVFSGAHRNTTGRMVGTDEDNCRVLIQDEKDNSTVSVSTLCVQHYDSYISKQKQEEREQDPLAINTKLKDQKNGLKDMIKEREREQLPISNGSTRDEEEEVSLAPWLAADIIVRVVDKRLKKGRYYKEKVRVVDVCSPLVCTVETGGGRLIEGVHQNSLETVIPRGNRPLVKVVSGRHRGRVGEMLQADRERCECQVMLSSTQDDDQIVRCSFDHVCQLAATTDT